MVPTGGVSAEHYGVKASMLHAAGVSCMSGWGKSGWGKSGWGKLPAAGLCYLPYVTTLQPAVTALSKLCRFG